VASHWKAGLFSATLTAFLLDSKENLKPSPADEAVYYLRQHSAILSQISVQLSSIAPQVSIPSTPPPPFPEFNPSASDIRVNIFWFTSLILSLLAAFLAIVVQRWVRDYMLVFQQYTNPLKSSRIRQYLYEGLELWYLPKVAEAVPGLLRICLFLFFAGLCDSLSNINKKVALSTIIPICVSTVLYIITVLAPIVYPQSPYHGSFSGTFWYLFQKFRGRKFKHRGSDGEMKNVSINMEQGRMQVAMEETMARKDRDKRAIRWLIDNMTEDAEMEKFLSAIPGSFNTNWGTEVWKGVSNHYESEDRSQDEYVARSQRDTTAPRHPPRAPTHATTRSPVPHPPLHLPDVDPHSTTVHIQEESVFHDLGTRIAHSVEICKSRVLFAADKVLWRKRTRDCIETTASLVCCANAKLAWFGGILELAGDIGSFENIRELSLAGTDELFVTRWTCLSLAAIGQVLENNVIFRQSATLAIDSYAKADDTGDDDALAATQKMNETLKKASDCLHQLYCALRGTEDLTEEVKEILRGHESKIAQLEQIDIEADRLAPVDHSIFKMQTAINDGFGRIISQFPGVLDDNDIYNEVQIPFNRLVQLSCNPRKLQFIRPKQTLKSMCSPSLTLRNILEGPGDADAYKELLKNLKTFNFSGWGGDEMNRQLQVWRLQDLGDGGGLGFIVELFFLALSQLLSTSSSKESHSALYRGTFRAVTSDWRKHKHSLGTQKFLLNIAVSRRNEFAYIYPAYIVDEFLLLLGNIFEGQTGPHIDYARQQFESFELYGLGEFRERVLRVLTRGQVQSPLS
jgi:hypothetical protein